MGYARGNNLGVRIAQAVWGDFGYIISNNDLVFPQGLDLSVATRLFESNSAIGIIGPAVTTPDGVNQSPQAWASPFRRLIVDYWKRFIAAFLKGDKKTRYLLKHCNDVVADAPDGECAWVSGCFFLARGEAFHKAGMFDENTFLYGEEMILSRRMERAGYCVWYSSALKVIHNHAQTTKKSVSIIAGRELDFRAVWYYYKNYTNTSPLLLTLARWNFAFYKAVFNLFQKIKALHTARLEHTKTLIQSHLYPTYL
jgi:GT2 family glycosyltransferase